jgi:hypothetical protein
MRKSCVQSVATPWKNPGVEHNMYTPLHLTAQSNPHPARSSTVYTPEVSAVLSPQNRSQNTPVNRPIIPTVHTPYNNYN